MKKFIAFSNIKGGTGKSLLCALFAMYCQEKGLPISVIDADVQQTLYRHREYELEVHPDVQPPYEILPLNTVKGNIPSIVGQLKKLDRVILVDCPGNIQDPAIMHILKAADIVVVPTRYDRDNLDATLLFVADYLTQISNPQLFFIPNSINLVEERREEVQLARANAVSKLDKYGIITPRVKQSVVLKCYSTLFPLDSYQRNAIKYAFDGIIAKIQA